MADARRFERIRVNRQVRIRTPSGVEVDAKIIDLSIAGAGILYSAPAEPGTLLELRFVLPVGADLRPFMLKGIVRHGRLTAQGHVFGVEFLEVDEDDRRALLMFVLWSKDIRA